MSRRTLPILGRVRARRIVSGFGIAICVASAFAGCTSGSTSGNDLANPAPVTSSSLPLVTSTSDRDVSGETDMAGRQNPLITSFDATPTLGCSGPTANLRVDYTTNDVDEVVFMVDQEPLVASPPINGPFEIVLPCDGNSHTIILVAVGQGSQAMETRAVRTDPSI